MSHFLDIVTIVTRFLVQKRAAIVFWFLVAEIVYIGSVATLFTATLVHPPLLPMTMAVGKKLGEVSLGLLLVALSPGIARRLQVCLFVNQLVMPFRRQVGIAMYLTGLGHWVLRTLVLRVRLPQFSIDTSTLALYGTAALLLATPLFITSNDFAVRFLGKKWALLHKTVYGVLLLLLFHTAVQQSTWAVFAGTWLILEGTSYLVLWRRQKRTVTG